MHDCLEQGRRQGCAYIDPGSKRRGSNDALPRVCSSQAL